MIAKKLQTINWKSFIFLGPLIVVLGFYFFQSLDFNLHDFSNSYFSARMIREGVPNNRLFDIYEFNSYIWNLGYTDVLADFYLNSPFTITAFYPLSFIENPYVAKAIFNLISILLFLGSIYLLFQKKGNGKLYMLLILPFVFLVSIRNQILFGQTYFFIFSLVVFGFLLIENKREGIGAGLLSYAVLLKIFPFFYGVSLLFHKSWKSIVWSVVIGVGLLLFSIYNIGFPIWETYFTELLPNAIHNNSTVDFRFNAQSFDVFLRTLFIEDSYYNPSAIFNSERMYVLLKWLFKSIVIAFAVSVSFKNKNNLFKLLAIWVVALFLLQSRTATYAQILWIIPAVCFLNQKTSTTKKVLFFITLFIVCNIPVSKLEHLPILFKFSRLWFTLLLAILFYRNFSIKLNYKWLLTILVVLLPLHLGIFKGSEKSVSKYVLAEKQYFLIYDYFEKDGELFIKALGRNGDQTVNTKIPISSFNEDVLELNNNQILINNKVIIDDYSLKRKPVLVNHNEVYYLTDHHSRRGAYTLKKSSY